MSHDTAAQIGILICDDNVEIRSIMTEMIVLEPGLQVVGHAVDGNEAVTQAKLLQPDVIVLDLAMPNRNGLDALPELALAAPSARTIVVSAFAAPSMIEEALRRGAVGYIEKGNLMMDELLSAIAAAFDTPAAHHGAGQ
jgi:two-component system, NarL family, invasion response regulator UvrY